MIYFDRDVFTKETMELLYQLLVGQNKEMVAALAECAIVNHAESMSEMSRDRAPDELMQAIPDANDVKNAASEFFKDMMTDLSHSVAAKVIETEMEVKVVTSYRISVEF